MSKTETKKRAPRQKKAPPTKEEKLKLLQDASKELKQIIQDLKDDELKLAPLSSQLKRVPELIQETIKNLEEDDQELNENYDEILAQPEEK